MTEHLNILSIDGGGRRGYMPAVLLYNLETLVGPLHQHFQAVAGTSTGAILAAGIAAGVPMSNIVQMYEEECPAIFHRSWWHRVKTLWGLVGPKYPIDGMKQSLDRHFGSMLLGEADMEVLLTSYDLQRRRPRMFKSWRPADRGVTLAYAARASAAAPTYFPAVDGHLVDGGVAFGDPAMCLLTDVCDRHPDATVTMLSLGTGTHEDPVRDGPGLLGWATKVADVFLDGAADAVAYQAQRYPVFRRPGSAYWRIQFDLPDPATRPMDGPITPAFIEGAKTLVRDPEWTRVLAQLIPGPTAPKETP